MGTVHSRYDMRKAEDGFWSVYDIFTGRSVIVFGVPLEGLDIEEADDIIDLLNGQDHRRDTAQKSPR